MKCPLVRLDLVPQELRISDERDGAGSCGQRLDKAPQELTFQWMSWANEVPKR